MKNWKKIVIMILMGTILLLPNEVSAASMGFTELSIKNIFLFIAILILVLLLYLGYRMDSNENIKEKEPKSKKNNNLNEKARYLKKSSTDDLYDKEYEEDSREYEDDDVNPEEISESVEYEEDEEQDDDNDSEMSLFESVQNNNVLGSTINFDTSDLRKELNKSSISNDDDFEDVVTSSVNKETIEEDDDFEDVVTSSVNKETIEEDDDFEDIVTPAVSDLEIEDDEEEYGEEFDISIIDKIDEEDEIIKEDSFIKKLDSFKEPETDFAGFSVASKSSEKTYDETVTQKRYTKVKPKVVENVIEDTDFSDSSDLDFLKQMERNLELGNNEVIPETTKNAVTKTTKKTTTRKKKVD